MEVTLSGSVMVVRESQEINAPSPMVVRLSGSVMVVRENQPENAESPMA